jgi:polar amino acid transport system substrate-binding protein
VRHTISLTACLVVGLAAVGAATAAAQTIPNLWDPQRGVEKPDGLAAGRTIRFLTGDDDPPFHFTLTDGTLVGFDVDLARAACGELKLSCTIQVRRRDTLLPALRAGDGDVLLAPVSRSARADDLVATAPYYTTPGRMIVRTSNTLPDAKPSTLAGHRIAVAAGQPTDTYLQAFFPGVVRVAVPDDAAAREAVKAGEVDAAFADAIAGSLWLNGSDAGNCCRFLDGPFTEPRIFGEGVGMVLRRDDAALRRALDWAIAAAGAHGTYAELYLKYFPIGFY